MIDRRAIRLAQSLALLALAGCGQTLYFYEVERISLTLETRPDPSQPVQGNLGLKQRVALISPPRDSPDSTAVAAAESATSASAIETDGALEPSTAAPERPRANDALSLISSFRFHKERGELGDLGPVTIRAALVSGEAAIKSQEPRAPTPAAPEAPAPSADLAERAAPPESLPVVIAEDHLTGTEQAAAELIRRKTVEDQLAELQSLVARPWPELSAQDHEQARSFLGLPGAYSESLHGALRRLMER